MTDIDLIMDTMGEEINALSAVVYENIMKRVSSGENIPKVIQEETDMFNDFYLQLIVEAITKVQR